MVFNSCSSITLDEAYSSKMKIGSQKMKKIHLGMIFLESSKAAAWTSASSSSSTHNYAKQ